MGYITITKRNATPERWREKEGECKLCCLIFSCLSARGPNDRGYIRTIFKLNKYYCALEFLQAYLLCNIVQAFKGTKKSAKFYFLVNPVWLRNNSLLEIFHGQSIMYENGSLAIAFECFDKQAV